MICFVEGFSWNISEKFSQNICKEMAINGGYFFIFPIKTQSLAILSCHSNQNSEAIGLNINIGSPCLLMLYMKFDNNRFHSFRCLNANGQRTMTDNGGFAILQV